MAAKPTIAIVGAGNLGAALTESLHHAGYKIEAVVARSNASLKARRLAKKVGAKLVSGASNRLQADVIWFCVPDAKIESCAEFWKEKINWRGKVAFHSSGALTSDALAPLRSAGAAVAAIHPFMTFVDSSRPSLSKVPFAIEGDPAAKRIARQIVKSLGAQTFSIRKAEKVAYHAWGTFASPFLIALLVTAEQVAASAGVSRISARRRMEPILRQTLENYIKLGPQRALSGPIVRGDTETVRRHLEVLGQKNPAALDAYLVMARAGVRAAATTRRNGDLVKVLALEKKHSGRGQHH